MSFLKDLRQKPKKPTTPSLIPPATSKPDLNRRVTVTVSGELVAVMQAIQLINRVYRLLDMSCMNLPRSQLRKYKYYAIVAIDGESQKTISADRGVNPKWNNIFRL